MSADKDKSLLDEYLADDPQNSAGKSELTRQYRNLPGSEPGGHLDRAILAEAREAVRSEQAGRAGPFWSSWLKPLTVVAAMGICLVLVLQVMQSNQRQMERNLGPTGGLADREARRDSVDELVVQSDRPALELPAAERGDAPPPAAVGEPVMRARVEREEQLFDMESRQEFDDAAGSASADFGALESRPSAPVFADAASPSPQASGDEIVVTARKTQESLQDVPLSVAIVSDPESVEPSARAGRGFKSEADIAADRAEIPSDGFDEIVVAARKSAADDVASEIVYPARDVWQAGIDAIQAKGDIDLSRLEQQKFLLVYPDEIPAEAFSDKVSQSEAVDPPAAEVWLAGIDNLIEAGEQGRAEEELLKFELVYPGHPAISKEVRDE